MNVLNTNKISPELHTHDYENQETHHQVMQMLPKNTSTTLIVFQNDLQTSDDDKERGNMVRYAPPDVIGLCICWESLAGQSIVTICDGTETDVEFFLQVTHWLNSLVD